MSQVPTLARTPLTSLRRDEDGQGLAEYALILSLIAVLAIGILVTLGPTIANQFGEVAAAIQENVDDPSAFFCDIEDRPGCRRRGGTWELK